MKRLKTMSLICGLAGASIMSTTFAASPPNIDFKIPNHDVDAVNAVEKDIIITRLNNNHKDKNAQAYMTINKFVGSAGTEDYPNKHVVITDGMISINNLQDVLNGKNLENNGDGIKVSEGAVILANDGILKISSKSILNGESNGNLEIKPEVRKYLKIAGGYIAFNDSQISKEDAIKAIKALNNGGDSKLIIVNKLLDEHSQPIVEQTIKNAIDLAKNRVYALSAKINVDAEDIDSVVFDKAHGDDVTKQSNKLYIPKYVIAKGVNFGNKITNVEVNNLDEELNEGAKHILENTAIEEQAIGDKKRGGGIIVANTNDNGDAISGGRNLAITLKNGGSINVVDGPTNNINARIYIKDGGLFTDYATMTLNNLVSINDDNPDNVYNNIGSVNGKMIFNDELNISGGNIYVINSDFIINKALKLYLNTSKANFENSNIKINKLDLVDGSDIKFNNSNIVVNQLYTDDRYYSKDNFIDYLNATKQYDMEDIVKSKVADKGKVTFNDSNLNIRELSVDGNNDVIFNNINNDNIYNIDILDVFRGGRIEINGGNLKIGHFIGSSIDTSEDDIVEGAPEGTYNPEGKIILNGGSFEADNLRALLSGELVKDEDYADIATKEELTSWRKYIIKDKPIIELKGTAKLKTKTDQIFEKAASTGAEDSGAVTNKAIKYTAGKLVFDEPYKDSYLNSANIELKKYAPETTTKIVMLGEELAPDGNKKDTISLDAAINRGENNIVTTTPIDVAGASKDITKLVIGEEGQDTAETRYSAKALNGSNKLKLNDKLKEIDIKGDEATVFGGINGDILKLANKDQKVVINVEGKLQLGNKILSTGEVVDTHVNADVKLKDNSQLTVDTARVTTGGTFTTEGTSTIDIINKGRLTLDNTKVESEAPDKVTISDNTTFNVGDKSTHGELYIKDARFNGAKVLLDPDWDADGGNIYSQSQIINTTDRIFDGKFVVGRNSVLALNAEIGNIELNKGENEAALIVWDPIKINETKGSLVVDPTLVDEDGDHNIKTAETPINTIKFANNTQFITRAYAISQASKNNVGVLNAGTISLPKVNADNEDEYGVQAYVGGNLVDFANLQRSLAAKKALYLVKAGNNIENNFKYVDYDFDNLINLTDKISEDKHGIELVLEDKDNKSIFNRVKTAYPDANILLANTVDGKLAALAKQATDTEDELKFDEPLAFINDTLADENNGLDGIGELNAMANLVDLGGVIKQSYADLAKFNNMVASQATHQGIWANYIHNDNKNSNVDLTGTRAKYTAKGNGFMLGYSLKANAKNTLGVAAFYNKTKVSSDSVVNTTNDAKSYGLAVYNTTKLVKGEIVSHLSYSHSSNDLKQYNIKDITAKAASSNYSLGAIYQKSVAKDNSTVTPYVGLRFTHLGGAKFTNSLGFSYGVKANNLVEMPFGVRYTTNVKHGNMEISPYAEIGYNALLSGKKHKITVGLNTGVDTLENSVLGNTWHAKVGANLKAGNSIIGFSYTRYQGNNIKDNQFIAEAQFKF